MKKEYTLGYFLEIRHIEGAFKLLKRQIEQESPLYNTLDFKIFREEGIVDSFNPKNFYEKLVKNDVFYYFQNEIYLIDYLGIQSAYKIRNFHFLSFKTLIIYNAIGLYIHEVLNQYHTDFDAILKKSNGKVFYGGKINSKDVESSIIFYYDDYQEFITKKEELAKPEEGKVKYIITIDIKSFFYTISHKILLSIIEKNATKVTKKALRFDENSIASIEFFLKYLMKGSSGIPVSSQNLVSNFLSSVYFSPFDQYLIDTYLIKPNISYIRYVDDFYLICEIDNNTEPTEARNLIYDIENDISDFLSNELGLSVSNDKGKRTKINDLNSYYEFLAVSSSTSPSENEYEPIQIKDLSQEKSIEGKNVQEIFSESVEIIKSIKEQLNEFDKLNIDKKDANFLNNILIHEKVRDYCKSKDALDLIDKEELFLNYKSLDYILVKIKVFLHLISLTKKSRDYFNFLILAEGNNIRNVNQKLMLIERFVLQLEFLSSKDPAEKVISKSDIQKYKEGYRNVICNFIKAQPKNSYAILVLKMLDKSIHLIDFKPVDNIEMLNLLANTSLMQQIKQRHLNERLDYFNVAFNHLLNEFQNLVEAAFFNREKKDALEIRDKLTEEKFKVRDILLVSDFFKRRNQNSISHSNDPELGFWGVAETEYHEYKYKIEPIMQQLLVTIYQKQNLIGTVIHLLLVSKREK
jgi:hypothetical protein